MWIRLNILIILLFLSSLIHGQSDSTVNNRLNVRIAPISLIDFYNGSCYKIGFEVQPLPRFSITSDFGGYFRNFNVWKNFSGFNIDIGLRYYLNRYSVKQRHYLSLNYFYKDQGFNYHDSILTIPAYYQDYRTQKYVTCVNVNFGWLKIYKKRIVLDLFAGLGIRYKKVNSTIDIQEIKKGKEYGDSQSLYFLVTPGRFLYPNINMGMRIGLRIF